MRIPLVALVLTALVATRAAAADGGSNAAAEPTPTPITFAPMVKKVAPSVVTVFSSRVVRSQAATPPWLEDDPMLRHFFGIEPRGPREQKQQGLGSGVIVRADGYILTNNHVVEDADEIKVGFADATEEYPAKVVGTDPKTDLAVLKIDAGKRTLTPIELGDSATVEVGSLVFAIGNPFGVGQTVTMGIVSAVGRGVGIADYEDFLQTDASINPGNSGGPLVDSGGKLVGINTAIISPTGANLGIGFAVPVNLAHGIMTSIIEKGKVVRGYLGVQIRPLTTALAKEFGVSADAGALVADVQGDSPAEKAGLAAGDVIETLDGKKIDDARHLRLSIAQLQPGTKITLGVTRDGKEKSVTATLGDLAEQDQSSAHGQRRHRQHGDNEEHHAPGMLGVRLDDLADDARRELRIPADVKGALITEVKPGSSAETAGLKAGMVIVEVARKPVSSAEDAAAAIDQVKGDVLLRVWQDGAHDYVVVHRE